MTEKNGKELFGTDGVRGYVNRFPMTVETILALGRAAGMVFRRKQGKHRVVVGKDTRLSCYMFENALIAGLCSMGVDTLMVGPIPSPAVAFITSAYRADAGVVISASHNPYYDNGIKFFSSDGFKLSDELEYKIAQLVKENHFFNHLPPDHEIGKNTKIHDADGRYIEFAKATFPRRLSLKNLKIVLDCAHGAAYRVAPLVFQELDAQIFVYGNAPNGLNINRKVGAMHPEVMQKGVIEHRADVGIAFDGDGDRVVMVDEQAQVVDGDTILAICAHDMKKKGMLKNNCIVSTVMSNLGLLKRMEELGIRVVQTAVGDRHVIQGMLENGANLGGEQSGHLIFLDHNTTGDGLISSLQVLAIMIENDLRLSELAAMVRKYPQELVNVSVGQTPPLEEIAPLQKTLKEIKQELGKEGKVLVRYSGTEKICRVLVEGRRKQEVKKLAKQLGDVVKETIGAEK